MTKWSMLWLRASISNSNLRREVRFQHFLSYSNHASCRAFPGWESKSSHTPTSNMYTDVEKEREREIYIYIYIYIYMRVYVYLQMSAQYTYIYMHERPLS